MKLKFKYPRSIDGKVYAPGEYQLAESLSGHWYVKALLKCGDVVVVEDVAVKKLESKKDSKKSST